MEIKKKTFYIGLLVVLLIIFSIPGFHEFFYKNAEDYIIYTIIAIVVSVMLFSFSQNQFTEFLLLLSLGAWFGFILFSFAYMFYESLFG
tara:strand:+ start:142 stop:408 length:267 start_codon:yes stop_codon:yes gene_type:complete